MNGRERLEKMLDEQEKATAAKIAALPLKGAPAPRVPHPDDGRSADRASGREYMLVKNIAADEDQPRKKFDADEIQQIAVSLKRDGQFQPLVVEWRQEFGKWVIVYGEKRWLAAQAAGMDRLWCAFVPKEMAAAERLKKQLKEVCLRSGIQPIEQARSIKRLIELTGQTQQQVADELQLSQSTVTRALQLLELPAAIQEDVIAGRISPRAGADLATLDDPEEQAELATKILAEGMNRDDVAEAVKERKAAKKGRGGKKPSKIVTSKFTNCKGTLVFRKVPSNAEIRAVLLEWVEEFPDEQNAAA